MDRLSQSVIDQFDSAFGADDAYTHYRARIHGLVAVLISVFETGPSRVSAGTVDGSSALLLFLEDGWLLSVSLPDHQVRLELLNPALPVSGLITLRDVVGARATVRRNGIDLFEVKAEGFEGFAEFAADVLRWTSPVAG